MEMTAAQSAMLAALAKVTVNEEAKVGQTNKNVGDGQLVKGMR